ncbi:MAG: class I SAM-dependent DNA methyltransferase [Eggerthellaceae bacterium]|nr:class I SAM-dependent DNA methyltransferase [Eggerthellaceae bacterium]
MQSKEQKEDIMEVFHGSKNCGNVDYVAGWYMKAAEYIEEHPIRCAFVSTNSICQGEQVANIWSPIYDLGVRIDFAHDTFRWRNEATGQAHVFVVIVGFSKLGPLNGTHRLFHYEGPDAQPVELHPDNINAYLSAAPDVFVWNRNAPICSVPKTGIGNKPIDGGYYLFKGDEKDAFIKAEPASEKHFKTWLGSDEFLNNRPRSVLWLGDLTEAELADLPKCRERIEAVRQFRLSSKSAPTRKLAEKPARFHVENMPSGSSILIPKVSSERRRYIPLGFIGSDTFCSDLVFLIPDAGLYHYGILHSQVHNAWMRTVAGRLKSDYRYSGGMVYNTFPWPNPTPEQKERIEQCAQAVLDARENHPGKSLADLYDPDKMPADLLSAHKALDAAVEAAYGVNFNGDEEKIVAHLFKLYAELTQSDL